MQVHWLYRLFYLWFFQVFFSITNSTSLRKHKKNAPHICEDYVQFSAVIFSLTVTAQHALFQPAIWKCWTRCPWNDNHPVVVIFYTERISNSCQNIVLKSLETIECRKGRAVLCMCFVTILWGASMQYITKLPTSQSQKPRSPFPQIIIFVPCRRTRADS